jgi:hypothetical protein
MENLPVQIPLQHEHHSSIEPTNLGQVADFRSCKLEGRDEICLHQLASKPRSTRRADERFLVKQRHGIVAGKDREAVPGRRLKPTIQLLRMLQRGIAGIGRVKKRDSLNLIRHFRHCIEAPKNKTSAATNSTTGTHAADRSRWCRMVTPTSQPTD